MSRPERTTTRAPEAPSPRPLAAVPPPPECASCAGVKAIAIAAVLLHLTQWQKCATCGGRLATTIARTTHPTCGMKEWYVCDACLPPLKPPSATVLEARSDLANAANARSINDVLRTIG